MGFFFWDPALLLKKQVPGFVPISFCIFFLLHNQIQFQINQKMTFVSGPVSAEAEKLKHI